MSDIPDHLKGACIMSPGDALRLETDKAKRQAKVMDVPEAGDLAWAAARADERARLVHHRDELQAEVVKLRAQLAAGDGTRTRHTLTCDRCRRTLSLSSSLALHDSAGGALYQAATWEGWTLSSATSIALGMVAPADPDGGERDLCGSCFSLKAGRR